MASSFSDWAWLPRNLLLSILEKIDQFSDYVRFSGVCLPWRRYALDQVTDDYKQRLRIFKSCHNKLPVLMMDTNENSEPAKRLLFSLTREITYSVDLPLPCTRRFIGSAFGWLLAIERSTMVITLLNPFTGGAVSLPPLKDPYGLYEGYIDDDDPEDFIRKAILSSDPSLSPNNYEVVVIYDGMCRLAMFKSGQESWNFIDRRDYSCSCFDVIYHHKGQIYGVDKMSNLVKIDFASGTEIALTKQVKPSIDMADAVYLVQSQEGDLLHVQRYWEGLPDGDQTENTSRIAVFKLLQHPTGEAEATWVPISRLGNQALFVGDNHSLSVSTLEFPECLPNCIYYTQHFHCDCPGYVPRGIDEDMGIFNVEEESFQSCCIPDPHLGNNVLPLIWFVPNMRGTISSCFQSTSCNSSGLMQSEFGKIKII
ncbi:uncharacterized protein LOC131318976 [Rhododendron vialii]|uniref:uncharacterized protein LOC131318976 n=1 Tax=Rhododendron vialii TaxID=182163 RepID=UPI00265F9697|nr:uncharacterized protein LOC131318976 [Rhododendron vialii]